jgi:hypothetical protein
MSLLELLVDFDDFCQIFIPKWNQQLLTDGSKKRIREGLLSLSEIMTIIIHFHQSRYRDFKNYDLDMCANTCEENFLGWLPTSVS